MIQRKLLTRHLRSLKKISQMQPLIFWSFKRVKQGFQAVQVFAFCVVNTNDEHMKHWFKKKLRG